MVLSHTTGAVTGSILCLKHHQQLIKQAGWSVKSHGFGRKKEDM
jgi:hypothetical protein